MGDLTAIGFPPTTTPFVTVSEGKSKLLDLIAMAATGTAMGVASTYFSQLMMSTPEKDAARNWRIGVSIVVPRFANLIGAKLATWNVPGSRRRIEFVVKAEADSVSVYSRHQSDIVLHGSFRKTMTHSYTVLNGSFQKESLSTEMKEFNPFRDLTARYVYGSMYESHDFSRVLAVIRSEITGVLE